MIVLPEHLSLSPPFCGVLIIQSVLCCAWPTIVCLVVLLFLLIALIVFVRLTYFDYLFGIFTLWFTMKSKSNQLLYCHLGTDSPSGTSEVTLALVAVHIGKSWAFNIELCRPLFFFIIFLIVIALAVFIKRRTAYDHPYGIFRPFVM